MIRPQSVLCKKPIQANKPSVRSVTSEGYYIRPASECCAVGHRDSPASALFLDLQKGHKFM